MKRLQVVGTLMLVVMFLVSACAPQATQQAVVQPTATMMPEPTATPEPVVEPEAEAEEQPMMADIVDTAVADGRFTTLVAAVEAAGLVETLKSAGPFTVFAPTDDAFAKLPAGTVESLLLPENLEQLKQILLYHVIGAKVVAADVPYTKTAETAAGLPVRFSVVDGKAYINDAEIILTDIETANGMIHVIDTVILPPADIVDTAVADGRFTTLAAALGAANLVDTLKGEGPFTVFAPTDEAFAKLPAGTVESLLLPENLEQLTQILTYHVVPGFYFASDVISRNMLDTVAGLPFDIKVDGGNVYINDAQVIITDIFTANGVIHVIDSVILPPADIVDTAVADGRFTTLAAALGAAGLVDTLKGEGPFTVFAPTDEAFAKLPAGTVESLLLPENLEQLTQILTYHVVAGEVYAADVVKLSTANTVAGLPVRIQVKDGNVFINDAQVVLTDIKAANGVIHVIDSVILPPADIVDTAVADGRFTTLAAALSAAGLVDTLKGEGPFTVFAPTDEAFAKLPAGTVESLLLPENLEQLTQILTYHVVPGFVFAADVVNLESANTVAELPLSIKVEDGKVYINESQVIITDIFTANGVIHVIDSVLLPE
jgi:transforming growth factor-beta-induced protein